MIDSGSRCPFNDGARVPFQDSLPDVSNNAEVLATSSFVAFIIGLTWHPFTGLKDLLYRDYRACHCTAAVELYLTSFCH
jgi:hypothetical protein